MAVDSDPTIRQRKPEKETETEDVAHSPAAPPAKKNKKIRDVDANTESRWIDVARTLTLLFAISCGLSYLVSSGESFFWNTPPKYLSREFWQSQFVRPLMLTVHHQIRG